MNALAYKYHAFVKSDGQGFRREARILQSIWREEQGYKIGSHRGESLGSLLEIDWARMIGANFLTDTIRSIVKERLKPGNYQSGQMIKEDRLYSNLLSSQPLSFNLFGELKEDLQLASDVFQQITQGRFEEVVGIRFEWSPGRGEPKYTDDNSAFDVYICGTTPEGGKIFAGIEVKYHEDLKESITRKSRYVEIAKMMSCFKSDCMPKFLEVKSLHQIWRDHLLAGIHRITDKFEDGFFVFLYPEGNEYCKEAVEEYQGCLFKREAFAAWTIEKFVNELGNHSSVAWIDKFFDRYLDFTKLERYSSS